MIEVLVSYFFSSFSLIYSGPERDRPPQRIFSWSLGSLYAIPWHELQILTGKRTLLWPSARHWQVDFMGAARTQRRLRAHARALRMFFRGWGHHVDGDFRKLVEIQVSQSII